MKFFLLALIAVAFASNLHAELERFHATWTSESNHIPEMSIEEFKATLNPHIRRHAERETVNPEVALSAEDFDARTHWPNCHTIGNVLDQAQCGSCWAFAGSEVLSDRFCIVGCDHGQLSAQDLVSCDYLDDGCNGGNLDSEWNWMKSKGICTENCMKYKSGGGSVPKCPSKCDGGASITRYKARSYAHQSANQIMKDLEANGPLEVAFDVYDDFRSYKSGVYHHVSGSYLGGHAVKLIGYGTDGSTPYWLIVNSWGRSWGMQGLFKILRGKNECGIESEAYSPSIAC